MTLSKMGIDINGVDIIAVGEYENYRGEIARQKPEPGTELYSDTRIVLEAGFPSPVDYMPYQFFYGLGLNAKRSPAWEMQARKLMAPFDATLIRHLSRADYLDLQYMLGFTDFDQVARFLELFGFEPKHEVEGIDEALIWSALLPTFHFWAGNPEYVEKMLRYIFGYEFRIRENVSAEYAIPDSLQYRLGSGSEQLGHGTILGAAFEECDSCYQVTIKGVEPDDISSFLPGKDGSRKLDATLATCMPGNLQYRVKIEPTRRTFELGSPANRSYLGYATYI
jgi:hypothetical protein